MMRPTPGITEPKLTADPLGTEGELTPGPDDYNPFDDPDASPVETPDRAPPAVEPGLPTRGEDPFVFDDVGGEIDDLQVPFLENGPFR
jgi:hypothetical protein